MSQGAGEFDELGRLAAALCEGHITPPEAARLEQLVLRSPAAKRFFHNYLQLHAELYWELAAGDGKDALPAAPAPRQALPRDASPGKTGGPLFSRPRTWLALTLLALVALLAGLAMPYLHPHRPAHANSGGSQNVKPAIPAAAQPAAAQDGVARLRALVAADPRLIHHYPFEGTTNAEKSADRRGDLELGTVVMYAGRGDGEVQFTSPGFDASTNAVRTARGATAGNSRGVALQSQSEFQPPPAMTVEVLLCYQGDALPAGEVAAVLATRENQRRCACFLAAVDRGHLVHLFDGDSDWIQTGVECQPGEWYYVAATFLARDGRTTINTYVANLTRRQRTLEHVVKDQLAPGEAPAGRLGVGKGFSPEQAPVYPWPGSLDELAIYNAVLPQHVLQQHLDAVVAAADPASPAGGGHK